MGTGAADHNYGGWKAAAIKRFMNFRQKIIAATFQSRAFSTGPKVGVGHPGTLAPENESIFFLFKLYEIYSYTDCIEFLDLQCNLALIAYL